MTEQDEIELLRLSDMLQSIDRQLGSASLLREGLMKAGIALSFGFINGSRSKIEQEYEFLDKLRKEKAGDIEKLHKDA
jgi:hypothetical protein